MHMLFKNKVTYCLDPDAIAFAFEILLPMLTSLNQ